MKELFKRLGGRPGIAIELMAASFFANMLALAAPLFVIQVLNRYVAYGVDATLATLTTGVVIAVVLEFGFRQARLKLAAGVSSPVDEALGERAFEVLTGAKAAAMDMLPAGLRREIVNGAETIQQAYNAPNIAAVLDVPFAFIFVVALFLISPPIAIVVTAFLVVVFLIAMVSLTTLRGPTRDMMGSSGRRASLIGSAMTGANTVRAFNAAGFMRRLWQQEGRVFLRLRNRIGGRHGTVQSLTQGMQGLMSVTVIAMGAVLVVRGEMDVGAMIGVNILGARALLPIIRLAQLGETFARARQSLKMLEEFVKLPMERLQGSALSQYKGGIEFKDVGFTFQGTNSPLFESLSLKLEPGTTLVVSGANGTGKTTLARLTVALLEPSRGQILVDGVDLAQVVPEWWRRQVVYLPQEPRFLNASIRDNLEAFNPDLDDAALNHLINTTGLRSFIDENPTGFGFQITNNGDNLSLGIRRRLALARALASDGALVVLDEPTEGLDAEGSARVYATMNDLAQRGRTIIAFSHDPNIVKGARHVLDLNAKPVPRLMSVPVAGIADVSDGGGPAAPDGRKEAQS